jgi:hypothetical protein
MLAKLATLLSPFAELLLDDKLMLGRLGGDVIRLDAENSSPAKKSLKCLPHSKYYGGLHPTSFRYAVVIGVDSTKQSLQTEVFECFQLQS